MAIDGEYVPSPAAWVRDQVAEYEGSGGTAGTTLRETGLPVVIVTNKGARTGAVRKTPLMRVEHQGTYAAIGSKGGAAENAVRAYNQRETGGRGLGVWGAGRRGLPAVRGIPAEDRPAHPGLRPGADRLAAPARAG